MSREEDMVPGGLDGLSTLDFGALTPAERVVVRLILRKVETTYAEVCVVVAALPEDKRLSQAELDETLKTLAERGWLTQRGEGPNSVYKVNIRSRSTRKAGESPLRKAWDALEAHDQAGASPPPTGGSPAEPVEKTAAPHPAASGTPKSAAEAEPPRSRLRSLWETLRSKIRRN
jgi:predicted transcriptional regulator